MENTEALPGHRVVTVPVTHLGDLTVVL